MSWETFMLFALKATYTGMILMLMGFASFIGGFIYAAWKGFA